jgi:hypothetical protein
MSSHLDEKSSHHIKLKGINLEEYDNNSNFQ